MVSFLKPHISESIFILLSHLNDMFAWVQNSKFKIIFAQNLESLCLPDSTAAEEDLPLLQFCTPHCSPGPAQEQNKREVRLDIPRAVSSFHATS